MPRHVQQHMLRHASMYSGGQVSGTRNGGNRDYRYESSRQELISDNCLHSPPDPNWYPNLNISRPNGLETNQEILLHEAVRPILGPSAIWPRFTRSLGVVRHSGI